MCRISPYLIFDDASQYLNCLRTIIEAAESTLLFTDLVTVTMVTVVEANGLALSILPLLVNQLDNYARR